MDVITIQGGRALRGAVTAAGSKNAALPIMAACIMADAPVVLDRVPQVTDVDTLALLLGHLGVEVKRHADGRVHLHTVEASSVTADAELVGRMRASFCVLGPLLARRKRAIVPLPGGCRIGLRPVDVHLRGLTALGADMRIERGFVIAEAKSLRGATIDLAGPQGPTVTGTANVLMAAVLARGETILQNAAREPEVVDLGGFLISLGARIEGLGTSTLRIIGVEQLGGGEYQVIPDRIEVGTLLTAGAITGGDVTVEQCRPDHLQAPLDYLREAGCTVETGSDWIRTAAPHRLRPFHVTALPYPGVPSDLQAQFMALAALAEGASTIIDTVFPNRFAHVPELRSLGAQIKHRGAIAIIEGVGQLNGSDVTASDLRASAALVLAGLAAVGRTTIHHAQHLHRGYENWIEKLSAIGARLNLDTSAVPQGRRMPSDDFVESRPKALAFAPRQ